MTAQKDTPQKPRAKAPRKKAKPKQKVTEAAAEKEATPETAERPPEPATAPHTADTTAPREPARPKAAAMANAPKGLTMAALAEGYLAYLADAGKGRGTQFSYGIDLDIALAHFGKDTDVASLTERKVMNFFESDAVTKTRAGKPKAQPTIDKTRRVLRQALRWAAEVGAIESAPIPAKKPTKKGDAA